MLMHGRLSGLRTMGKLKGDRPVDNQSGTGVGVMECSRMTAE